MSADQTAATYGEMGGQNNADTQQNITQYFATVPSGDLDVALDAEASSLRGTDNSQEQWAQSEELSGRRFARSLQPDVQVLQSSERGCLCGNTLCA